MKKISELDDKQLCKLIDNRWTSSESIWDVVEKTYAKNLQVYKNEPEWLGSLPKKKSKVRANRVFVNTEAVINSLIANPPRPNILPGRNTPESKKLASLMEKFFSIKYTERNVKEVIRKGLRNLYFSRLIVLKPFWNSKINDFDVKSLDPRKIRVAKNSTKEEDSEFAIEEIDDSLSSVLKRFPSKSVEILKQEGYDSEDDVLVENPQVKYKEAWCWDYVIFKMGNIILGKIRNPYWDWDGILVTPEEEQNLQNAEGPEGRRNVLNEIKSLQPERVAAKKAYQEQAKKILAGDMPLLENMEEPLATSAYLFNHFDHPRKPYIFATILNNENTPIGQTDMIGQATPLQEDVDETKRDIAENRRLVNGILKVDSTVMTLADAQKLRFETGGIIWGKGVQNGVTRETGPALPAFVNEAMLDSRREIDNIMAASSAFKGQREGQETRGGRLALIDQSFLLLNELTQVVDYVNYELFNWFFQLAKTRYTEHHYAKSLGKDTAVEVITLLQDDFEDGTEVRVISGKSLPEDRQFKYEQAQKDMELGILSPVDYFEIAGYDAPGEKAKDRVLYDLNKPMATGITEEELKKIVPEPKDEPPKLTIGYADLPVDGKIQAAAKAGINLDPQIIISETMKKSEIELAKVENKNNIDNRNIDTKMEIAKHSAEMKNMKDTEEETVEEEVED